MWGYLEKMLQREGAEPAVPEKFSRTVIKPVLFFGS